MTEIYTTRNKSLNKNPAEFPSLDLLPEELIFGRTDSMRRISEKLHKAADTDVPILIQGETGTGKEIIAQYIHRNSLWGEGPLVKISCPAIPAALVETELFGFEEGAFTGADRVKKGKVESAHGGTLFLDEIAEMDPNLQAKLLQVLQDANFSRVGGLETKSVQVRVLCTTNRNLNDELAAGRFRQDLFYRINGLCVHLPPLRERIADIPLLSQHFIQLFNAKFKRSMPPLSTECLQLLFTYPWPGNIREFENLMSEYVAFGSEKVISEEIHERRNSRKSQPHAESENISLKNIARKAALDAQRNVILNVLESHGWNRKKAAKTLHISYRTLLYKIKDAGIPTKRKMEDNLEGHATHVQ